MITFRGHIIRILNQTISMKTYELIIQRRDNSTYYRYTLNVFHYLDNYILLRCISNFMNLHKCLEQIIILPVPEQCVLLTYLYFTLYLLLIYLIINPHVLYTDWKCPSLLTIVILNCHNSLAKSTKLLLFYTDIANTILYMVMYVSNHRLSIHNCNILHIPYNRLKNFIVSIVLLYHLSLLLHLPYYYMQLLRVYNDMLFSIDQGGGGILVLLDLSSAFDTIDHAMLFNLWQDIFGISGSALDLLKSYLDGRTQCVQIDGIVSEYAKLVCGVPQGSVLGPLSFCAYMYPIGSILRHHGIDYHIYADDTQLYITFDLSDPTIALDKINLCISDLRTWMIKHKLKINDSKTEFMVLTSSFLKQQFNDLQIKVGNSQIKPSTTARNLGVTFDSHLNLESHINSVCRSAYFHLRNIRSVRKMLTYDACSQLIHALVTVRIDYCNSLLYGLPDQSLNRLQRIVNTAARILCRIPKFGHISETLMDLHWLPVQQRVLFKVLILTYQAYHKTAPSYLCDLITPYSNSCNLRSNNQLLLASCQPRTKLKTYGERSFQYAAPNEWNNLPLIIRESPSLAIFKNKLKTFLFHSTFST